MAQSAAGVQGSMGSHGVSVAVDTALTRRRIQGLALAEWLARRYSRAGEPALAKSRGGGYGRAALL